MRPTRNKLIVATAATALLLGGAGTALAAGGGDDVRGDGKAKSRGADRAHAAAPANVRGDVKEEAGESGEGRANGRGADRARSAALAIVQGGTANSVERDSENGATWEVEVTRKNGSTVDVRLDAAYQLVVIEDDSEDANEKDDEND